MTDLVAAGSAALGRPLSDQERLASSERSVVLRCRSSAGSVIVKSYPADEQGAASFAAEAAGLEFTSGTGVAPELLAADPAERLIVMADLAGDSPSLADLLLGSSPGPARDGLLSWARACGQLAVRTAGKEREFAVLLAKYGASLPGIGDWLPRRIGEIPGLLTSLSFAVPGRLDDDLAEVTEFVTAKAFEVFSPGDICPDNNLITADGLRFIDFENAGFHSVFLDAAYLRMPFSTCWCVFALPGGLAGEAEAAYRELVSAVFGELADDAVWSRGLRLATTAWTLHAMTYLLDRGVEADASLNPDASLAPTKRQLLRYRWRTLADELDRAGELPAIRALIGQLLTETGLWQVPELPLYPAFR
ncbi:MAG TPA: hypothetical protein VFI65_01650 [Streptosporangiaceae bacterium]|nr:hypothetical protein [Streptosporangiaceae bacterium]